MGFLDRFKKIETRAEEEIPLPEESGLVQDTLLQALINNKKITKNHALSVPVVSSAIDLISGTIAMLDVYLYKETIIDGKRKIEHIEDRRCTLLNDDTGDTLDGYQLKKAMIKDYFLDKGGFCYIYKNGNDVKSLHYVDAESVSYFKDIHPIFKDGKYIVHDKSYELWEFIALLRDTKDGIKGIGLMDEISDAISTAFENLLFELQLVKKGGVKKGFLKANKKLSEPALAALKNAWRRLYSQNTDNMMILNDGVTFEEAGNTGVELQMNERKRGLNDEINKAFHIFDSYDETVRRAIMPIISAFESALNKSLLLESEKDSHYFSFDTKEITRGNIKERYEAYKLAMQSNWITPNEVRYLEDKEELEGLDMIPFSLANVFYNTKTKEYFTPNTTSIVKVDSEGNLTVEGGSK